MSDPKHRHGIPIDMTGATIEPVGDGKTLLIAHNVNPKQIFDRLEAQGSQDDDSSRIERLKEEHALAMEHVRFIQRGLERVSRGEIDARDFALGTLRQFDGQFGWVLPGGPLECLRSCR